MSIETEFESTITNVKNAYQGLDNLGATIPENKTIENIKSCLSEIYSNLPKTSYAEGSNITLSNTLKGKLDFEDDIVGYGQTEQKSYTGKNLFPPIPSFNRTISGVTVTSNNGKLTLKGTATASINEAIWGAWASSTALFTIPRGNYYASGIGVLNTSPSLNLVANGTTTVYGGSSLRTFTSDTDITGVFLFIENGTTVDITFEYQIESGISATSYEPYVGGTASPNPSYPQDIEVVRGTQTVYIKDENNNIIDTKTINLGEYEFAKIGNYVDTIEYDVDEDKVYKNKAVEKIASYNGQTITTDYISTTGQLTTGAKVYYGISTTKEEITGTLKDQIKALYNSQSFTGTTIIEINGQLPLIIKVRANSEGVVPSGSISITSNGTHDVTNYATANVNVTPSTETKTVKSTTTSQTINPTSGKLISQITVQPITLDIVNVTPSTSSQTITPTNDGIGQVNVSAVTSSIDNNIVAGNIKKNVSILGVTGTYEGGGSSEYNAKMVTTVSRTPFNIVQLISEIPLININGITNIENMFTNCYKLTTIPLLDTSSVTNMNSMFTNCYKLTTIPLLDTSSVTNMNSMFCQCQSLTTIPLLDTSSVTSMTSMFYQCQSLTTIPLLDTSSVTNMNSMFANCYKLKTIPLLDTSSVTSMTTMFYYCSSLRTIPLLDTSSVTNMGDMFSGCSSLTNESINNILAMCINATSYTKTKTLKALGFSDNQKSIAETLSNWSAFVEAGWTA